ncbi:MAG TPA: 2-amino-4-hydroxy-6-hydroxymethyldihydropteridine diphosphokinase [Marinilabiliaceae bacterium]|nr:2-amino-4-hydroxy-6-hydroxymethyldihydropteridine diphosphokinase [Marinilabiliaceae bacterium]
MEKNSVVIGMGSNIDPYINFSEAISRLRKLFTICALSPVRLTKPIGIIDQPDFINCALLIKTSMSQSDVELTMKNIEDDMGRDRTGPKFGPRNIDLDVVIWNDTVVDDNYYQRDFLKDAVEELTEQSY